MTDNALLLELWQEKWITDYLKKLNTEIRLLSLLITQVNIVNPKLNQIINSKDVLINNGKITKISDKIEISDSFKVISGKDKFLIPGFIDMHVHTRGSNSHYLFNLLNGITTVREMGGLPWMLTRRELIKENKVIGPRLVVGGHMLNYNAFHHFITVVKTIEDVERVINQQKRLGYDFIKVWNNMPLKLLKSIKKISHKNGLRICGHIPSDVDVEDAIDNDFYTLEHFKGYINDKTGKLTHEDFVSITPDDGVWNCPTFALGYYTSLNQEKAFMHLKEDYEFQFISPYIRNFWIDYIESNHPKEEQEDDKGMKLKHQVFHELFTKGKKFVIGTDFGSGHPLCVPGFGLLREMKYHHEKLGVAPSEILKMATTNASEALILENEIGFISEGCVADLVLVSNNPLNEIISIETEIDVIFQGKHLPWVKNQQIRKDLIDIHHRTLSNQNLEAIYDYYIDPLNIHWLKPVFVSRFAEYLLKENKLKSAVEILRLNLELSSTFMDFESLGDVYQKIKDMKKAENMWRTSIEINPYNEKVIEKLNKISKRMT